MTDCEIRIIETHEGREIETERWKKRDIGIYNNDN